MIQLTCHIASEYFSYGLHTNYMFINMPNDLSWSGIEIKKKWFIGCLHDHSIPSSILDVNCVCQV